MNIAMVSVLAAPHQTADGTDSLSVHIAALARRLGASGHQVTVYTRRTDRNSRDRIRLGPGVTVEQVPAGPTRPISGEDLTACLPAFGERLARDWRAKRPDLIHAYHWTGGLAALCGADGLGVPVVQTFHSLGSLEQRAGRPCAAARIRLEKAIGLSAHAVITTTECESDELVRLGVPRPRIATVPSGVDVEVFDPNGPSLRRGNAPRLVTLCRPAAHQGVHTAIAALTRVPEAELVVAGGPPAEELDGDVEVHRLRVLAKEADVADRVAFIGRLARADVPKLLRSADLTVSLPSYETFGRVPLESMACGTPVVVSAVGGHLDSVIDGVTGIHVPVGRPGETARRIRALLEDHTRRAALGIGGADRVRSRYAWDRIASETLKAYEAVRPAHLAAAS